MAKQMSINELIVLPYSPTICRYTVNDSVATHACSYEQVVRMISDLCPTVMLKAMKYIERRDPFLIDVKKKVLLELKTKPVDREAAYKQKLRDELYNPKVQEESLKGSISKDFWRKK